MTVESSGIQTLIGSRLFKVLRLGIPFSSLVASLYLFVVTQDNYASWFLILSIISIILMELGMREGDRYIASHSSVMRVDLFFVDIFRPFFKLIKNEETFLMSFFKWNNEKVSRSFVNTKSRKTLLLLPHCIQWSNCTAPILEEMSSCYNCGSCHIETLVEDSVQEQWNVRITNRSYKAYIEAKKSNPDLIVAVSCTDRLLKGVRKLSSYPSFLIPLELPFGMCVDATFNYNHLSSAMSLLAHRREANKPAIKILKHG
ncbi:MAG: DUF116 domain-containing protein [Holophagaceae bacterium]